MRSNPKAVFHCFGSNCYCFVPKMGVFVNGARSILNFHIMSRISMGIFVVMIAEVRIFTTSSGLGFNVQGSE